MSLEAESEHVQRENNRKETHQDKRNLGGSKRAARDELDPLSTRKLCPMNHQATAYMGPLKFKTTRDDW